MLYNPKAKSGYLYHKIKNEKSKVIKPATDFTDDELKTFLEQCVVSNDRKGLKDKLAQSVSLRRQLLKENGDNFHKFFKFYFVDPSLVIILILCKISFHILYHDEHFQL